MKKYLIYSGIVFPLWGILVLLYLVAKKVGCDHLTVNIIYYISFFAVVLISSYFSKKVLK